MIWSTLLCRFGRHRLTNWRRVQWLNVSARHCKRTDCAYSETRAMTVRTRLAQKVQLRDANAADTITGGNHGL